jgi:hypothetical protein
MVSGLEPEGLQVSDWYPQIFLYSILGSRYRTLLNMTAYGTFDIEKNNLEKNFIYKKISVTIFGCFPEMEFLNGICSQGINTSLLRLKFLFSFLP